MTYDNFISKLEQAGIGYTLFHFGPVIYVELGRYGYRFENGQSKGGWTRDCEEDWQAEWDKWFALLKEPIHMKHRS